MFSASRYRLGASRQRSSNNKRKAPPTYMDKGLNKITKCKDFYKSSEGVALCSKLVSMRMDSGTNLTKREMAAINTTLEYNGAYSQEFATDQCPAGGDVSWLASRDVREKLEQDYTSVENEATARRTPTFDPDIVMNKILDFNKEHILQQKKRQKHSTAKPTRYSPSEDDELELPFPLNEEMFEFEEAMQHLDNAKSRNILIKYWDSAGLIPVSKSTCARLWKQRDDFRKTRSGSAPKAWKVITGRPQLATTSEFLEACAAKEKDGHMALSKTDICKVLTELSEKHSAEKNEWKSEAGHQPDRRSVDRYFALYGDRQRKNLLHGKVQKKSMTHFTGEHSLRSSGSFAGVEAAIGLIVGEDERPNQFKKPIEEATDGAQKLEQIVWDANDGESVYPVQPGMQFTFDDTTVFACEGINNDTGKADWKLLDPDESYAARSAYAVDLDGSESSHFRGQRIRLSFTMAGNGRVAPIWATRTGLTESELPSDVCPSGIYITQVPGLTIGGSNVMQEGHGYVAMVRSNAMNSDWDSVEKRLFEEYQERVFYPFLAKIREVDYGWDPSTPIPEWLRCAAWCDGCIPQLAALVDTKLRTLDEQNHVIRGKHAAACSAVQQMADLMSLFRGIKQQSRLVTAKDNHCEQLKHRLETHFRESSVCSVEDRKMKPVLDLLACLPSILTKVCSCVSLVFVFFSHTCILTLFS